MSKTVSSLLLSFVFSIVGIGQGPTAHSPSKGYQLGPGDEVTGKVLGESQFDFVATVNEDGSIHVPFSATPVLAVCRTEKELRSDLSTLLSKQLKNPQFSIYTKRNSRPPTIVHGEVRKPENYVLMRKATLLELIAMSGGPTEEAGGIVEVTRTQPPLCADDTDKNDWAASMNGVASVPMKNYRLSELRSGKDDPVIYPGDMVRILRAPPIYVIGEVVAPQGMFLREEGMTVREAITKLGGVRREAKTKEIKIYRLKDSNSKDREVLLANLDLINKGEQRDIALEPYDIVQVDKSKDSIAETIVKFALGMGKTAVTSGVSSIGYRVVY